MILLNLARKQLKYSRLVLYARLECDTQFRHQNASSWCEHMAAYCSQKEKECTNLTEEVQKLNSVVSKKNGYVLMIYELACLNARECEKLHEDLSKLYEENKKYRENRDGDGM